MSRMRSGRVALAVAAAVAVLVVARLGDGTSTTGGPAGVDEIENAADDLAQRIWGTPRQREALDYLTYQRVSRALSECMARDGLRYRRVYLPSWTGHLSNATAERWLGRLQLRRSDMLVAQATARRQARQAADPQSVADGVAWRRCEPEVKGLVDGGGRLPHRVEALSADFTRMLGAVERRLPPIDRFTRCMARQGVGLAGSDVEGATAVSLYLLGRQPRPGGAGWTRHRELEGRVLDAEEACRAEERKQGLEMLRPQLAEFAAEHAADLARTESYWRRTERRAVRLGLP